MGALYLVRDEAAFGRLRVLKEMLDYVDPADYPDRETYEEAVSRAHERFEAEGRILASLHHPGIPEIIAYFSESGRNYIVMEYVEGEDLSRGLTHIDGHGQVVPGKPYPPERVFRWGIQVCKILEYLEAHKPTPVIHHDIKPANMVLDKHTGDIRLVDFGTAQAQLAAQADLGTALRKPSIFGTMGYAPPEQYQGTSVPKSDVYALAATMYHLLTDDDPQQHPMAFPWPASLGRSLIQALDMAVEPDPRKRSSALELRRALERHLAQPPDKVQPDRIGEFRVVLSYVPDQALEQTVRALQRELSFTETEATIKALSAPTSVYRTTSFAAADSRVLQLRAAGIGAKLAEVDERYSRALGPGALQQHLMSRGEVRKLILTKLSQDRRCRCFVCGHHWIAPKRQRRRPPVECPKCHSKQWNLRRAFKCRACGHEFAHGDQEAPAYRIFPTCPACETLDWLPKGRPLLRLKSRKVDLGTVRLDEPASVILDIRNQGDGELRGLVRSQEPWLKVDRRFSGTGQIIIPLALNSLRGEQRYQGLVDVLSNGGAQQVHVEFVAQTPERLSVSPSALDFGQLDAQPVSRMVHFTNTGGGLLRGSISSDADWIDLGKTRIEGNDLKLGIVARPAGMKNGAPATTSIRVSTNGGDVNIPVRAQPSPPRLVLTPKSVLFAAVPPKEKRIQSIRVSNDGAGVLQVQVTAHPDWIDLSKTRWSGNSLDLDLEVDGRKLADGPERRSTIRFSSNGGKAELPVRATPQGPTLSVEPLAVYLGEVPAGSKARFKLRLGNLGNGSLTGIVQTTRPWLHVEPRRFSGKRVTLRGWLKTDGLAVGSHSATVEIESNGGQASVVVQVQIKERSRLSRAIRLFR
jgi:hypothetical protein